METKRYSRALQKQSHSFLLKIDCPTRIDFTGGFTDVVPFRNERSAHHVNLAIESRIFVTLKSRNDSELHIVSSGIAIAEKRMEQLDATIPRTLISHLLQKMPSQCGLDISICSYAPIGAGLGTSGSLTTALLAGLRILHDGPESITDLGRLAMDAVETGNSAGMLGGCQDEFAAAFGNLNYFSFTRDSWEVLPLELSAEKLEMLESHVIIAYPGGNRISGNIVRHVMSAYEKGDSLVSGALHNLNQYATEVRKAFINCNWQELLRLVREIRHEQQKLHPLMIDKKTEHVVAELERYSGIGVKLLGGGGPEACILVVCGSDHEFALSQSLLKKFGH